MGYMYHSQLKFHYLYNGVFVGLFFVVIIVVCVLILVLYLPSSHATPTSAAQETQTTGTPVFFNGTLKISTPYICDKK